jgi:formylglycine-generating enzyme required for sulfatase activity
MVCVFGISRKVTFASVAMLTVMADAQVAIAQEHADREFQECIHCPLMVGIPAGHFLMGSPADEPGRFQSEGPQHTVTIRAFALGKYMVTSKEFLIFLSATGYQPKPCNPIVNLGWKSPGDGRAYVPHVTEPPQWPAVCLDWNDAEAYVAWLNREARHERPALASRKSGPYRLPSEAEWEYAARGGTTTARWWGNAVGRNNANCNGCGSKWDDQELAVVNAFAANPFGLYGMLGNAWQWTADCWHVSYVGAPADGRTWSTPSCTKHVLRGGSWDNVPLFVRSAARSPGAPDGREYDYSSLAGFRIARDLP